MIWRGAWKIARRDLSPRFKGLRLLVICLVLGVGAMAAVGTLASAVSHELAANGRETLGGDLEIRLWQRTPSQAEMAAFSALGTVSTGYRLQAMASHNGVTSPMALKAVDQRWPMTGRLVLTDGRQAGAPPQGEVWLSKGAQARLRAGVGDSITIGAIPLKIGGIISRDSEQLAEGFNLGAPVISTMDLPEKAGLVAPGAMYRTATRIALPAGINPERVAEVLRQKFPSSGFEIRTRNNASPGTDQFVKQMGQFLSLISLTALVIAGIGIGGGVSSYLAQRQASTATLKILGASARDITRIYLLEIGMAALTGTMAGLVLGAGCASLGAIFLSGVVPIQSGLLIKPAALVMPALCGMLVAVVFTALPLARARVTSPMALVRGAGGVSRPVLRMTILPVLAGIAAIVGITLLTAEQPHVAAIFLAGAAIVMGALALLGLAVSRLAAKLPRPRSLALKLGLASLYRPGGQSVMLLPALGFGLAGLVMIVTVQTSLDAMIQNRIPARVPAYFVLDIPKDEVTSFTQSVQSVEPKAGIRLVPALRGSILAWGKDDNNLTRTSTLQDIPDDAWALKGERGLTFSDTIPEGNTLVTGEWWPAGYNGPPLVSVDEKFARAIGLGVGDRMVIGLLGTERAVTVASLRRINWESLGFNHVLVFSPNALRDVPHSYAATIDLPDEQEAGLLLSHLSRAFPASSVIETGGLLTEARLLMVQMASAILIAASASVLAGIAVLLGTIAATRARRLYENVILRVLGASSRQLLAMQLAEYGLLLGVAGLAALILGAGAGWIVIVKVFGFDWLVGWASVALVLGVGLILILGFAMASLMPLLRTCPAQTLREL